MLLQPLVQNRIISIDRSNEFQLDWNSAAPILNLNFFHTIKLIEESSKYRKLLRPWEEKTEMALEGGWIFNSLLPFREINFNFSFTSNGVQYNQFRTEMATGTGLMLAYYHSVSDSDIGVYMGSATLGQWLYSSRRSIMITDTSSLTSEQREELFNYLIENATPQLKLHQYYTSTVINSNYNIYPGSWVGRVSTLYPNDILKDCLVLTSPYQYYIFDYDKNDWVLNGTQGVPCILRPAMTGLKNKHSILLSDSSMTLLEKRWQITINNVDYLFAAPTSWSSSNEIPIQLEQDLIMGRVTMNHQVLANVPVTILRKWNSQQIRYEYALTFPNLNFPSEAQVEFY